MKTFKIGGIHPPDYKLSANSAIRKADMPDHVVIMLNQHLGVPAEPIVFKGDEVKVGQLIAKANGYVSANIHSSVSGKVLKIDDAVDVTGYKNKAIYINVTGDNWIDKIDRDEKLVKECNIDSEEIIKRIADAGIVGMGGAGFPTHVKLKPPEGKKAEVLIVNAVECEPFLTSDHRLMIEKGDEILVGLSILMKAVNVDRGIIGIENNKMDAIEILKHKAESYKGIKILPLKVLYPQGGEKQLIESAIGRQVPSGALPVDVGAIVQNVSTVFAVYEAVQKNKPLFERVITITGKNVNDPGNFIVRIGTTFSDIIEGQGGMPENTGKIISGGPMMGKAVTNLSVPLTKGSSGILFISENETPRKEIKNCIRCAKCVEACPMGLEPFLFMTLAEHEEWEKLEKELIMDCIECGCCTFSCPSTRPLLDYLRLGKSKVGAIIKNRK